MKYLTFNQALLAVGLVGLVVALSFLEGNSFAITASLLVDNGPSIAGPVALMVVSVAIPLAILLTAWSRMRLAADEAPTPLSYAQARLVIGLAGLVLLVAVAPQVVVANSVVEWEGSAIDSIAYLGIGLIISAAILGSALASWSRETGPIDRFQLLMCLGLTVLVVVVVVVAPALIGLIVTGAEDAPELKAFPTAAAFRVYSAVSLGLMLAVLPSLLLRGAIGTRWALAFLVLFVGIAASVHLVYTLSFGLPLMILVATSFFAGRADTGTAGPIRSGPLLTAIGLLSLVISVSSIKYVISLYHACSPYDASLYLWPTLALVVAVLFSLGIVGAGVRRMREGGAPADEAWGE
ncbi:MAG: hypothetical protein OXG61_07165 [Chloroflexi bacterium]|nr:hypothetical protein [Chloroflexota bacterium]